MSLSKIFLVFLSVLVIVLTVVVTYDTLLTNKIVVSNNHLLQSEIMQPSQTGVVTIPINEIKNKLDKSTLTLKETSNHILDNNTISYLMQIFAIVIIGISLYFGFNVQKVLTESKESTKKIQKLLKQVNDSNTLIRYCESMLIYSTLIKPEEGNENENISFAFRIEMYNTQIQEFIYSKDIKTINQFEKKVILQILFEVRDIIENHISTAEQFYNNIKDKIQISIEHVERLKEIKTDK